MRMRTVSSGCVVAMLSAPATAPVCGMRGGDECLQDSTVAELGRLPWVLEVVPAVSPARKSLAAGLKCPGVAVMALSTVMAAAPVDIRTTYCAQQRKGRRIIFPVISVY